MHAIATWWMGVLKRGEVPLSQELRNPGLVRDLRPEYPYWPRLMCRRTLYLDFAKQTGLGDAIGEMQFFIAMAKWLYPYGADAQVVRREVFFNEADATAFGGGSRQQRYFVKMAEPTVLNAHFAISSGFTPPLGGNAELWNSLITNEELRARCVGSNLNRLTDHGNSCLDARVNVTE